MLFVKALIILSIILSSILALFSACLLASLVSKEQNFMFTRIIANIGNEKTYLQTGTGIILGSSIFLTFSLIPFFKNYNCGFGEGVEKFCESDNNSKPKLYHQNRQGSASGKMLEAIISVLNLFLFIGVILFSIDFFSIYNEDNLNQRDINFMWSIFGLALLICIIITCLFLYLLVIKKPTKKIINRSTDVDKFLNDRVV